MKKFLFLLSMFVALPSSLALAVYCGQVSVPGGGGTGVAGGDSVPCTFWVAASGGSDGNTGTSSAAPFATLEKAQTSVRGVVAQTSKVVCLKAGSGGTYNRTTPLVLGSADSGETWEFDPASGVNTAVLDGGSTTNIFTLGGGVNNVKINGIKMQHVNDGAVYDDGSGSLLSNITVENCEMAFNNHTGAIGGFNPMLTIGNVQNAHILHNYIHDTASQGIGMFAFQAGQTLDGLVIDGNVVLNAVQVQSDGGAIYADMRNTNINGGHITITNNFVRDYGANGVQAEGIYLDDDTSNATVSGNIVGPPNVNMNTNGNFRADTLINGGCCNTFSNNIVDLGATSPDTGNWIAGWSNPGGGGSIFFNWVSANSFSNNIVVSGYTGALTTRDGVVYDQAAGYPANFAQIQNNTYHNYGGGPEATNGTIVSDSSPIHVDPKCTGYLYAIGSPPAGFTPIVGGWGPPNFVIPTTTNFSCSGGGGGGGGQVVGRNWRFIVNEGGTSANWTSLNSGWALQPFDGEHSQTDIADSFNFVSGLSWSPTPTVFMLSDQWGTPGHNFVDMAQAAAGAYDTTWNTWLTSARTSATAPIKVVRIWQEINGNWMSWSVNQTGATASDGTPNGSAWPASTIIGAFQHMANQVRSAIPTAKIEWNLNCGGPWSGPTSPGNGTGYDLYPGDAFVDMIGIDCYEKALSFSSTQSGSGVNLNNLVSFATTHNKMINWSETAAHLCDSSYLTSIANFFDSLGTKGGVFSYYDQGTANNGDNIIFSTTGTDSCSASTLRAALNASSFGQKAFTGTW